MLAPGHICASSLFTLAIWYFSTTGTGTYCDPRRSRSSNNTLTLGTSYVCWSIQDWIHLVGRLGYRPDVDSVCWGSVPKIDADG